MFKGESSSYRVWHSKIMAKLRATYGAESDPRTILDYIHSRTKGQAWQIIENHIFDLARRPWTSIENCWEELDSNYMSQDEEAKADMDYTRCKQAAGEPYTKWIITLRDLAACSDRGLKSSDVWMKLNDFYQKKTVQVRFKPSAEFDGFCTTEENAYEAMKAMRPTTTQSFRVIQGRVLLTWPWPSWPFWR